MQWSFAEKKSLCPSFSQIHKDTPWRWQKLPSVPSVHGPGGPAVLSEAQVTLLTGVVAKVTARVPLCSSVICDVMAVELDKIGVAWRPSTHWVRTSVKAGTVIQACRPVLAERARSRCEARSTTELTTESDKFGIADAHVINVDETSLHMIPVNATGWSVKGEKH